MCWEVQRDQDGRGHYDPPKSLALRLPHSTPVAPIHALRTYVN